MKGNLAIWLIFAAMLLSLAIGVAILVLLQRQGLACALPQVLSSFV